CAAIIRLVTRAVVVRGSAGASVSGSASPVLSHWPSIRTFCGVTATTISRMPAVSHTIFVLPPSERCATASIAIPGTFPARRLLLLHHPLADAERGETDRAVHRQLRQAVVVGRHGWNRRLLRRQRLGLGRRRRGLGGCDGGLRWLCRLDGRLRWLRRLDGSF